MVKSNVNLNLCDIDMKRKEVNVSKILYVVKVNNLLNLII